MWDMERKSECFFFFMFLGGFLFWRKKKIASSFLFILLNVGFFFFPLFFLPENYPEKNSTWINPFLEQNLRVTYLFTYLLIYLFIYLYLGSHGGIWKILFFSPFWGAESEKNPPGSLSQTFIHSPENVFLFFTDEKNIKTFFPCTTFLPPVFRS